MALVGYRRRTRARDTCTIVMHGVVAMSVRKAAHPADAFRRHSRSGRSLRFIASPSRSRRSSPLDRPDLHPSETLRCYAARLRQRARPPPTGRSHRAKRSVFLALCSRAPDLTFHTPQLRPAQLIAEDLSATVLRLSLCAPRRRVAPCSTRTAPSALCPPTAPVQRIRAACPRRTLALCARGRRPRNGTKKALAIRKLLPATSAQRPALPLATTSRQPPTATPNPKPQPKPGTPNPAPETTTGNHNQQL